MQVGRRPAVILSPIEYNNKTGIALCCPIASRIKGYPFEVRIPEEALLSAVILSDQIKSLDWRVRNAVFAYRLPEAVVHEVWGSWGRC